MRKLFTLLFVALFASGLMAQQATDNGTFTYDGKVPIDLKAMQQRLQSGHSKELSIGWLIPSWNILDYYWGSNTMVTHYANVIFPDSTPVYESGGVIKHNWLNSVGGVFDPCSEMFDSLQGQMPLLPTDTYRIDTIFVLAWYNVVDASNPDTLVVELENGDAHTSPEFAWTVFSFPNDTFDISPPKVLGNATEEGFLCPLTAPGKTTIKYPLTLNDSTNVFGKYIMIPVNYSVPAGKIVGLSITFVPGQIYAYGDMLYSYSHTSTPVLNSFRVGLYGTTDTQTDPFVFAEPYHHWTSHNYIRKEIRYSMYTGGNAWRNERMVSTVSWGFDIGYYVTNTTAGIGMPENKSINAQIYPNPASDVLNIRDAAAGSRIRIIDMVGHCLVDRQLTQENSSIDLKKFQSGLYFIEMTRGGETTVHKFAINR